MLAVAVQARHLNSDMSQALPVHLQAETGVNSYEVWIPSHTTGASESVFSAKNFVILFMCVAMVYLGAILVQICFKKNDGADELSEEFFSQDSLSYDYTYEEYTNSQYLRSDDENSLVDYKNFKYDQSLKDSASRRTSSVGSEAGNLHDFRLRRRSIGDSSEDWQAAAKATRKIRERQQSKDQHQRTRKTVERKQVSKRASQQNHGQSIELSDFKAQNRRNNRESGVLRSNYQPILSQENER